MKINITCIISCYNEAKNIPLLLKTIYEAELQEKINFIIINNGSNDNSRNLLKVWSSKYKKIKFIDNRKDNGWGYGIKTGLISNKNSIVGWTHGDMEYSVYDLKKVLKIISSDEQYFTKTNIQRFTFAKFHFFKMSDSQISENNSFAHLQKCQISYLQKCRK